MQNVSLGNWNIAKTYSDIKEIICFKKKKIMFSKNTYLLEKHGVADLRVL